MVHGRRGQFEDAHDHHRQALQLHRETGSRIGEIVVLNNIGLLYQQQGRYDEARHRHHDALELSRSYDFPGDEAESLNALAEAARSQGRVSQRPGGSRPFHGRPRPRPRPTGPTPPVANVT
ncbi:tetratricopeptide repeat protein [Streptomyces sp. NPDC006341]|uniref:tetratricopeptide repeat protein n=1 Tax=Streptomyces sp. NPDC006341 TaxID=3156756 RepID=UPI0033A42C3D